MALEGKVLEPLVISDTGLTQYMTVSTGLGNMNVLPSPNTGGIFAQMKTAKGMDVKLEYIGDAGKAKWAILLNNGGQQYGQQISYDPKDLRVNSQVFYVGSNDHFSRSGFSAFETHNKKSEVGVNVFGTVIKVRYFSVFQNPSENDINSFCGFVYRLPDSAIYKMWFAINGQMLKEAVANENFREIRGSTNGRFAFNAMSSKESISALRTSFAATAAPSTNATIRLYEGDLFSEYAIKPGQYVVENLVLALKPIAGAGIPATRVREYADHLAQNHPVLLGEGKTLTQKTNSVKLEAGQIYHLRKERVVVKAEFPQHKPAAATHPTPSRSTSRAFEARDRDPPRAEPQKKNVVDSGIEHEDRGQRQKHVDQTRKAAHGG